MHKIIFCLMLLFIVTATSALAGADHGHGEALSPTQIQDKASGLVATIIDKGQLAASWKTIKPQKVKETSNHKWLVTFVNPEEKDSEKQTLYMFLTLSGEYIAANFTGK